MLKLNNRIPYPSDLSDKQWKIIEPNILLPELIAVISVFTHIERYWVPSFICCVLVAHGECYLTNFHIGRPSTPISVFDGMMEFGNA